MASKWRKAKLALGLNTCLYVPRTPDDSSSSPPVETSDIFSDAVFISPTVSTASARNSDFQMPTTPMPSSSGLRLPKNSTKSSKELQTCAICLTAMRPGHGPAIFTAECSHTFHFRCITANVKHGNQVCPVCRLKWKEIPFKGPASDLFHGSEKTNHVPLPPDDASTTVLRRLPPCVDINKHIPSLVRAPEPLVFDDDELVNHQSEVTGKSSSSIDFGVERSAGSIEVKTYPEIYAVAKYESFSNFTILIHLKGPSTSSRQCCETNQVNLPIVSQNSRAPVDLVTVLDVSGSMAGTKLALLKRAMGFVIQNLSPSDRLSIIAFSSTARRLFPLRRMTITGMQEALQAVNLLLSNGGTNIAQGLRKGAKVMTDRKWKNPVSSIILLSDGQDTYTGSSPGGSHSRNDYQSLLPFSMHRNSVAGPHIPVHTFGFGSDHDAVSMHSIAEASGGTFSFIETESVIQDAFAQCIGGILSVVVQELQVVVECVHPSLRLGSIKAGSYKSSVMPDARTGFIEVGDLYAEEERDFLVTMDIPVDRSSSEMSLIKVKCVYKDSITKELITLEDASTANIQRLEITGPQVVSVEVDRQRNRLRAADAIAEARAAAERGDLAPAVSVLEICCKQLSASVSAQAGDRLSIALGAELREMQERMGNRRVYESSGRAYVLSGLSSHSWQRATARGDSTDSSSLTQAYQTPSMVDMVNRSQTMIFGSPSPQSSAKPVRSIPDRMQPR